MTSAGYGRSLAAALVGSAATIGPIIPPSIIMIVYASVAGVSIARMFLAGVVPGLFIGLALMVIIAFMAKRDRIDAIGPPFSIGNAARATWRALPVLGMPMLVIGGILGGIFTPTESASIACLYGLFLGLALYRTIGLRDLPRLLGAPRPASTSLSGLTCGARSFARRARREPCSRVTGVASFTWVPSPPLSPRLSRPDIAQQGGSRAAQQGDGDRTRALRHHLQRDLARTIPHALERAPVQRSVLGEDGAGTCADGSTARWRIWQGWQFSLLLRQPVM
jgi:hypothetical protein